MQSMRMFVKCEPMGEGFQAYLSDGRWAAGSAINNAIGDLVRSHPEAFGLDAIEFSQDAEQRLREIQERHLIRHLEGVRP